jgi:hypothetical protein
MPHPGSCRVVNPSNVYLVKGHPRIFIPCPSKVRVLFEQCQVPGAWPQHLLHLVGET